MASPGTETQLRNAEQLLQGLALFDKPLDIPGNFRAKQRRVKHDDSKLVFPNPRRRKVGKQETDAYKTHYNHQFRSKPKNARPSSPRPCSPTRRNNPHPSRNFLNWRIPTRVFDYGKVKNANISFLKSNIVDSHQRFYDDYSGRDANRDQQQIDPRELLDMAKTYAAALQKERTKAKKYVTIQNNHSPNQHGQLPNRGTERVTLGMKSPPNSPVGVKLPSVMLKSWSPEQSASTKKKGGKSVGKKLKSTSPTSTKTAHFSSWYDTLNAGLVDASSPEGDEIMDEQNLEMALGALKPEALEAIEHWLLSASDEERQIAMKFIEAIILASVDNSKVSSSPTGRTQSDSPNAVPMQFLAPYPGIQNISSTTKGAHHHNHTNSKACEVCKKKELESALQKLQAIASLPTDVPAITELLNPLHPTVLYEKEEAAKGRKVHGSGQPKLLNRRLQDRSGMEKKFVPNKGSVFMNSKRTSGRHFTIHPEWN